MPSFSVSVAVEVLTLLTGLDRWSSAGWPSPVVLRALSFSALCKCTRWASSHSWQPMSSLETLNPVRVPAYMLPHLAHHRYRYRPSLLPSSCIFCHLNSMVSRFSIQESCQMATNHFHQICSRIFSRDAQLLEHAIGVRSQMYGSTSLTAEFALFEYLGLFV